MKSWEELDPAMRELVIEWLLDCCDHFADEAHRAYMRGLEARATRLRSSAVAFDAALRKLGHESGHVLVSTWVWRRDGDVVGPTDVTPPPDVVCDWEACDPAMRELVLVHLIAEDDTLGEQAREARRFGLTVRGVRMDECVQAFDAALLVLGYVRVRYPTSVTVEEAKEDCDE